MKKPGSDTRRDEILADVSTLKAWRKARRMADAAAVKLPSRRITINLDGDIIAIFKARALRGGLPYQVAINKALREYLHLKGREARRQAVEAVLAALDDPAVKKKIQVLASPRRTGPGSRGRRPGTVARER